MESKKLLLDATAKEGFLQTKYTAARGFGAKCSLAYVLLKEDAPIVE